MRRLSIDRDPEWSYYSILSIPSIRNLGKSRGDGPFVLTDGEARVSGTARLRAGEVAGRGVFRLRGDRVCQPPPSVAVVLGRAAAPSAALEGVEVVCGVGRIGTTTSCGGDT
jgi:hypothetical protein